MRYVIVSPCILNPKLRANGITTDEDIRIFNECVKICRDNNIKMIPYICSETLFLGENREPGNFIERLDVPEFYSILNSAEKDVREIISKFGKPVCIIGVNSSPVCGVTSTYYTDVKSRSPGVFMKRFSDLVLTDVCCFVKMSEYYIG